jgi:hypothetical protein
MVLVSIQIQALVIHLITLLSQEIKITPLKLHGISYHKKVFSVIVNPGTLTDFACRSLDGINYNTTDATKATLVLDAPFKDFIYMAEVLMAAYNCLCNEKGSYLR